jgi:hypothetical protein
MLDALHRPERILRVQLRPVYPRSPDEQLRQAFVIRVDKKRCPCIAGLSQFMANFGYLGAVRVCK